MKIALVTDSTGDFAPDFLDKNAIPWVPNYVIFGEDIYADRINIEPEEFYRMLSERPEFPSTSQPTPADLEAIYKRLAGEGYDHIVSIHISDGISGTCNSATLAAKTSPIPVTVVDSKTTTTELAFAMEAAVAARDAGGSVEDIIKAVNESVDSSTIIVMLDTLEALVRGGRAGRIQGLAASLLNIKLIVTLVDGKVEPWKKVKGKKKAIEEMVQAAVAKAEEGPIEVVLLETDSRGEIEKLREALEATGAPITITGTSSIGPTVSVHTSTGAIGLVFRPMP